MMTDFTLLSIDDIGLSVRARNALRRTGVHTVADMLGYDEEMLYGIPNLGKKSVDEILEKIDFYLNKDVVSENSSEQESEDAEKRLIREYLSFYDVRTEALDLLSARVYNVLTFAGYDRLEKFIFMTEEELETIEGMNRPAVKEVMNLRERYLLANRDAILSLAQKKQQEMPQDPFQQLSSDENGRKAILTYVKINNVCVENMKLSTRSSNRLISGGYKTMADMIFMTRADVINLSKLGENSVNEIVETIEAYRKEHIDRIRSYFNGDTDALIEDKQLIAMILNEYSLLGFGGLSVSELRERLEKRIPDISESRIKKMFGRLIADGELEYVDFRCYRIYKKFSEFCLNAGLEPRDEQVIKARLEGKRLEEIGESLSITRERVRQIVDKKSYKIRQEYERQTGMSVFDEDYYVYFYTTYDFDHTEIEPWLGISGEVKWYMDIFGVKKGNQPLDAALKDNKLDAGLRLRIKNYINRDKIYIDGKWIKKNRASLEAIAVKKYCTEPVTFTEFRNMFNAFLKELEIPYDENIYYTDAVIATRKNRFTEERTLLWRLGETFRYYDIDGQDYTELFETLHLDSYHDIELSTEKFMMEYPELMEKYDIRDAYELHNLLKKILDTDRYGRCEELKFSKMPILRFGTPDRDFDLLNMMVENAPIRTEDLYELIHKEYGYDLRQIPFYTAHLAQYSHKGIYSIGQREMSEERLRAFQSVLREDFYTFDELKTIYLDIFEDADQEEINTLNLKRMGFTVNSKYVIQNYSSAVKYIETRLTESDDFDIQPLSARFSGYGFYDQTLMGLRKALTIVEYKPGRYVNFRKLEKAGLTRDMVSNFCDAVYHATADGEFFSIHSLCRSGFDDEVFSFGFDDLFYGSLLISDKRFFWKKVLGTMIFCKTKKDISIKALLSEIIDRERKIDRYDLENLLKEEYGCSNVSIAPSQTERFYDPELQRFYADEELYYQEIDETEGFYS